MNNELSKCKKDSLKTVDKDQRIWARCKKCGHEFPLTNQRVNKCWMFVSEDGYNNEGIVASRTNQGTMLPLLAADENRIQSLLPIAQQICDATEKKVRLLRSEERKEIMVLTPKGKE